MSENGAVVAEILKLAFVTPTHRAVTPQKCADAEFQK